MSDIHDSQQRHAKSFLTFTGSDQFAPVLEPLTAVDPIAGQLIENYKIVDKIGEGAMAVVYRAIQISTGRTVAIKTLRYAEQDLSERFSREISIHSKLKHKNIVEAIACISTPQGRSYFVMEYLRGMTLEDKLISVGRCETAVQLANILGQVCNALDCAHQLGIIHRDIKPENIILLEDDGVQQVKVLDFGVAKIQEDLQRLTKTGVVLGSPAYMSPEQCMGIDLDPRSDIYSLGVVAYELVTGNLPFDADTPVEMMEAHCDPDIKPMPITQFRKDFPATAQLQTIFNYVLQTEAEDRPATIDDLKRHLDLWWKAAVPQSPDQESPFQVQAKATKVVDKNKSVLKTADLKSLESLTGRRNLEPELKPKQPIARVSKKTQMALLVGGIAVVLVALIAFLAFFLLSALENKNQPGATTQAPNR